ncbi:DUF3105 domain-containing protein [Halobaculum sp. MBLA0147]|uniref:DUF3105 domain-containing protein n=1 Tax=Halobaculum sp. MBLA0147 TaxID=3079934 RepID=UPI0035250FE3
MPECDHCGESFADEASYAGHLQTAHDGELSRIDRRRVAQFQADDDDDGRSLGTLVGVGLAVVLVAGLGVVAVQGFFGGSEGGGSGETGPLGLPPSGDDPALSNVERFDSAGADHVAPGARLSYPQSPPLSGPHYGGRTVSAGFYEERQSPGALVHSLEHGAVVIYYDPGVLSADARDHLRGLTTTYTDPWGSVIVTPAPTAEPAGPVVLTAWRTRLVLDAHDPDAIDAFLAEYLGRGPENPIR